jgi:hypothetical protein
MSKIHGTTVHVLRDMDLGGLLREYIFEYSGGYCTRKPTNIVHIDGQRYRLVDRKAKVGDRFINKAGEVYVVDSESTRSLLNKGEYFFRILEPVEPADIVTAEEGNDKSVLDLLANLAHRLTTLEQQVARRVTELEQKLNFVKSDVNMILDDIVTLDERTQPLVALVKAVKADE